MTYLKTVLLSASALCVLGACSPKTEIQTKETANKTAVQHVDNNKVPHAQLSENVAPTKYNLEMKIDPRQDGFSGVVTIDINIKEATDKIWLHGQHITVTNGIVKLANGKEIVAKYSEVDHQEAPSGVAWLSLSEKVGPGEATLVLPYETPFNMALNSAYKVKKKTKTGTDNYIVTQFEAIGARQAFPGFDEPRFKVPFDLSISAPSEDVVYANTPLVEEIKQENGWTKHVFETTRPLPTYLIAFGVGPWDILEYADLPATKVRNRTIPLRGIAVKGKAKEMEYALKNTAGILEALESYFGIPYPYEKLDLIAAPDFNFGAMENPGAIVFTEYLLLMNEKSSLRQRRAYASVNSHELAHQWFGDLVTPIWWEDIWLNEAFATWMGNKGIDMWKPDGNFGRSTLNAALGTMSTDSLTTTRQIREPLLRSERVMDQFDGITYRKGGGVLAMFESFLGEELFQKGVRLHMDRFKDGVASADDFFQSMADGSGNAELVPALKSFVDQPGLPLVSAELNCKSDSFKLKLSQSRYAPHGSEIKQGQSWQIPVCVSYDANGTRAKTCKLMTTESTVLDLETNACPTWISVNADGAGYYRFSLDKKAWAGLLNNLDKLNTKEVLTVMDSLKASFAANKMDATTYLNGLSAFAQHSEYDVASTAGNPIWAMHDVWLDKNSQKDVARFTKNMYEDRYNRIKDAKGVEASLLVPTLASRLVHYGHDKEMTKKFADAGAAYLGLNGKVNKSALAANVLGLGFGQAYKAHGKKAKPILLNLVQHGTPPERSSALGALTSTEDLEFASQLRDMVLNDMDTFTDRQALGVVSGLLGNTLTAEITWAWLQTNFDEIVEKRVPDARLGSVPSMVNGFCDAEKTTEIKTFFESKKDIIPGSERALAQTLERVSLCASFVKVKRDELAKALAAR